MINIISRSYLSDMTSGPQKVAKNLVKGLDLIGYPYIINGDLDSCRRLWIHDDLVALDELVNIDVGIKTIIGPNLYVFGRQIPDSVDLSKTIYLHPSEWTIGYWRAFGFSRCPLVAWPVGIDTYENLPSIIDRDIVLIYFKQRLPEELMSVESKLQSLGVAYKIITYGSYLQSEYVQLLKRSKYIIWLGRQESQGIALQEAMSMNIPILVWDVIRVGHWLASPKEMNIYTAAESDYEDTTAAYYFDDRCGIKLKNESDLMPSIQTMEASWKTFNPREYVLENLSLEKKARDFINFYDQFYGLSYISGLTERRLNNHRWRNAKFIFLASSALKDKIKKVLKIINR